MNEAKVIAIINTNDFDDFEVNGARFRFYNSSLWINGEERDDIFIREIDGTIEITENDMLAFSKAVANGLYDPDDDLD